MGSPGCALSMLFAHPVGSHGSAGLLEFFGVAMLAAFRVDRNPESKKPGLRPGGAAEIPDRSSDKIFCPSEPPYMVRMKIWGPLPRLLSSMRSLEYRSSPYRNYFENQERCVSRFPANC